MFLNLSNFKKKVSSLHKMIYPLIVAIALLGLLTMFPFHPIIGQNYSKILIAHITLGIVVALLLIKVIYSHALIEVSNPFKLGFKKWNGFKLLVYLFLAIISGLIIIKVHYSWLIYFHGFIGLWSLLVGWKHKRTNTASTSKS